LGETDASLSDPRLEICDPGFLAGAPSGSRLTWFVEATSLALREAIWIDAHEGQVVLHLSRVADARFRRIYDGFNNPNFNPIVVRVEGGPAANTADADAAYTHTGDAYSYFFNQHGRDSYDDAGAALESIVRFCSSGNPCPFLNASWVGGSVGLLVFGDGFARADDVVAHELTHAVTEYEATSSTARNPAR
jgi:Zn-dependent metalloprotease